MAPAGTGTGFLKVLGLYKDPQSRLGGLGTHSPRARREGWAGPRQDCNANKPTDQALSGTWLPLIPEGTGVHGELYLLLVVLLPHGVLLSHKE